MFTAWHLPQNCCCHPVHRAVVVLPLLPLMPPLLPPAVVIAVAVAVAIAVSVTTPAATTTVSASS
jgi:hypothetical protein